ncbi:uncharacterized protein LOC143249957 [Tachypleus tridentatus]|uniref:uncharacterized protein LOC143249957 n=1 Tax=Tachypleus tridentatus TaxID=6853 RepID=UPI003FD26B42
MSAICQNFVQNTWKKDLCSNCFKSLADHVEELSNNQKNQVFSKLRLNGNPRYISQATTVYQSRCLLKPTTWKTSLTERRDLDSPKPFKLENGYNGKHLRITSTSEEVNTSTISDRKISLKSSDVNNYLNGHCNMELLNKQKSGIMRTPGKKNESGGKSGVAFVDGPEVIGYGGNDFVSDDEWETSSDEGDINLEFFDVTEEDKAITKITKENTTFNANYANLRCKEPVKTSATTVLNGLVNGDNEHLEVSQTGKNISVSSTQCERSIDKISSHSPKQPYGTVPQRRRDPPLRTSVKPFFREVPWSITEHHDRIQPVAPFQKKFKSNVEISDEKKLIETVPEAKFCDFGLITSDLNKDEDILKEEKINSQKDESTVDSRTKNQNVLDNLQKDESTIDSITKDQNVLDNLQKDESTVDSIIKDQNVLDNLQKDESTVDSRTKDQNVLDNLQKDESTVDSITKDQNVLDNLQKDESTVDSRTKDQNVLDNLQKDESTVDSITKDQNVLDNLQKDEATVDSITKDQNVLDNLQKDEATVDSITKDQNVLDYLQKDEAAIGLRTEDRNVLDTSKENSQELNDTRSCSSLSSESSTSTGASVILNKSNTSECLVADIDTDGIFSNKNAHRESGNIEYIDRDFIGKQDPTKTDVSTSESSFPDRNTKENKSPEIIRTSTCTPDVDTFQSSSENILEVNVSSEISRNMQKQSLSDDINNLSNDKSGTMELLQETSFISINNSSDEKRKKKPEQLKIKPQVPKKPVSVQAIHPQSVSHESEFRTSNTADVNINTEQPIYSAVVKPELPSSPTGEKPQLAVSPVNHYAESNIYQEINNTYEISTNHKSDVSRNCKLAALAVELEQVRFNSVAKRHAPPPPKIPEIMMSPQEGPMVLSVGQENDEDGILVSLSDQPVSLSSETPVNKKESCRNIFLTEGKIKNTVFSPTHSRSKVHNNSLEDSSKSKKGKFSLKKFLKRGKDPYSGDSLSDKNDLLSPNPKAWKQNEFDRSKLRLEIIHPMDMVNPNQEEEKWQISQNREVHVALSSAVSDKAENANHRDDETYDQVNSYEVINGLILDSINCSVEHEKTPNITDIRKPSSSTGGSALTTSSGDNRARSSQSCEDSRPARPPKPPPPPRCRSLIPSRINNVNGDAAVTRKTPYVKGPDHITDKETPNGLPSKPQVPRRLFRPSMKSEYSNLDVRYFPMSKKSEPTSSSPTEGAKIHEDGQDDLYEPVGRAKCTSNHHYQNVEFKKGEASIIENMSYEPSVKHQYKDEKNTELSSQPTVKDIPTNNYDVNKTEVMVKTAPSTLSVLEINVSNSKNKVVDGGSRQTVSCSNQGEDPSQNPTPSSSSSGHRGNKTWEDLHASYSVVVASCQEALVRLLDHALKARSKQLRKPDGSGLKWSDFVIENGHPDLVLCNRACFHAVFKFDSRIQVTLVISRQEQSSTPNSQRLYNFPILDHFKDVVPGVFLPISENRQSSDPVHISTFVLQRAKLSLLHSSVTPETSLRQRFDMNEIGFIMLQLIQILKNLQAEGIEKLDPKGDNFLLAQPDDQHHSFVVLLTHPSPDEVGCLVKSESEDNKVTLCHFALKNLFLLLRVQNIEEIGYIVDSQLSNTSAQAFVSVANLLDQEKAFSLSHAKALLEYMLWGPKETNHYPEDVSQQTDVFLQRWLDVNKAQILKTLSATFTSPISIYDENHASFLMRTNVRSLKELSSLLKNDSKA